MTHFALLIARQRSGTGALGSVLGKHPRLTYLGEILHPANAGQEMNFFTYFMRRVQADPALAMPGARQGLFLDYLDAVAPALDGRLPILDIKYRSFHHLNGNWHGPLERPWIIQYARQNKLPILRLRRDNYVETFVSGLLAEQNKVWHASSPGEAPIASTPVEIAKLMRYIEACLEEDRYIARWLEGYGAQADIAYGEAFDAQGMADGAVMARLTRLLGVAALEDLRPAFIKQAPRRLADAIENFEQVQQALAGTAHAWMAADS